MSWNELRHNGVAFPPPYSARGISVRVLGEEFKLSSEQEEMMLFWVKKMNTPLFNDPVAQESFLKDFTKTLPSKFGSMRMEDVDLTNVISLQESEEQLKQSLTKERKKELALERKIARDGLKKVYASAVVDGKKIDISNWMVEPPGVFAGRGSHPLRGRWKRRIYPQDVVLNLGEGAPIPEGRWKEIVHDHKSIWIAKWFDELSGKWKYVWPADSARIRQIRDKEKYDLAKKLERGIGGVRRVIGKGLRTRDNKDRKLATVCYLIDKLVMRVGDEKDEDELDTVGASTLRVEHVTIDDREIRFDFLGKDAVPWSKSLPVAEVDQQFVENLKAFMKGKAPSEPIFDGIGSEAVNRFLDRAMEGLTAKVFRTYHATKVVTDYLDRNGTNGQSNEKMFFHAKMANLEAARACNHKRTPPKNWETSLMKKEERLEQLRLLSNERAKAAKTTEKLKERIRKVSLGIELAKRTREYNLSTSLRNYIDPRVYKAWADHVGVEWKSIYTKSILNKLGWAARTKRV